MTSKFIRQFHDTGLTPPLQSRPGLLAWVFFLTAAPFLLGASLFALFVGGPLEFLAGLIGLIFFGFCFFVYFLFLMRGIWTGSLQFSESGLFHGLYNIHIPWDDIGPAWVYEIHAGGITHRDVLFILKNTDSYKDKLGFIERFLFNVMERQIQSNSGGVWDTGLEAFCLVFGKDGDADRAVNALNDLRQALKNTPGAIALPIPKIMRFGISNEDIAEVINHVIVQKQSEY